MPKILCGHHWSSASKTYKDINLQIGRFWASSLASFSFRSRDEKLPWLVIIQVICGRPGGHLQLSGGGSKMTWLASAFSCILTGCAKKERRRDLTMDESGGWLVVRRMSAFLIKSCQWMTRILHRHHWSSASIRCRSTLLIANIQTHKALSGVWRPCTDEACCRSLMYEDWVAHPWWNPVQDWKVWLIHILFAWPYNVVTPPL